MATPSFFGQDLASSPSKENSRLAPRLLRSTNPTTSAFSLQHLPFPDPVLAIAGLGKVNRIMSRFGGGANLRYGFIQLQSLLYAA